MTAYRFSPLSRADIREITNAIKRDNIAAARQWLADLQEKCGVLARRPRIGRDRSDLFEHLVSFPFGTYLISYRVISGGIEVVSVLHGARDLPAVFRLRCDRIEAIPEAQDP